MHKPEKHYQTKRPFDWFGLFIFLHIVAMVAAVIATLKYG